MMFSKQKEYQRFVNLIIMASNVKLHLLKIFCFDSTHSLYHKMKFFDFKKWNFCAKVFSIAWTIWYTYLLVIKSSWCIKRLNYRCSVSKEKRVACSTTEHAQNCKPRVCHILWRETTIPYAKHMWQSFEQSPRILGPPWSILKLKKNPKTVDYQHLKKY